MKHGDEDRFTTADVVVLGSGISGLVGASVLLRQGVSSIVVVDEYEHVGGNHIDVSAGPYTFDVGSLIFQDDSPLLDHFPQLMDGYVAIDPTWGRLNPQGIVTEYPFSLRDDYLAAGPVEMARMALSALWARVDRRPMRTAYDYARRSLGARFLIRSGLEHYMERFYGCPIDQIDLVFAESRMKWVKEQTRPKEIGSRVWRALRGLDKPSPDNRQLVRPRAGFSSLYAPVVADLESRGVQLALGLRLQGIQVTDDGFVLSTSRGNFRAARLISTIPVERAMTLAGLHAPPLPTVTLISLFYSFKGTRGFDDPIVYNFSHHARWKRLTVYSDFYGSTGGREFFTVEVVADAQGCLRPEAADTEFREHAAAHGLLRGDLVLEGSHELDNAYPIYVHGSDARATAARAKLGRIGIESFGRQGGFQYQPTARASTVEAESALHPRDPRVMPANLNSAPTTSDPTEPA